MARDPSHPWIGESVPLDFASQPLVGETGIPDFDSGDPVRYLYDGTTVGLEAGQSFIAGFLTSESLLSGDDAVAAFVVEVSSGSGTLRLSSGVDPDFTLTDPADASDVGGTFDVDGPTTLVIPVPSFDVDTYLSEVQEQIGRVECLAGFVILSQVRLRIWPSTGPVGGWSTDIVPAQTITQAPSSWSVGGGAGTTEGTYESTEPDGIFEDASAEVVEIFAAANEVLPFTDWAPGPLGADLVVDTGVEVQTITPETIYAAGGNVSRTAGIALQPDPDALTRSSTPAVPGATFGLDYTYPPDIVPGDLAVLLTSGDPTVEWGAAEWDGSGINSVDEDSPSYLLTPLTVEEFQNPEALTVPPYGGALLPSTPSPHPPQSIPMPDSRAVMLSLSSVTATNVQGYGGPDPLLSSWHVGCSVNFGITLGDSTVTIPAYRYWTPTAAPWRKLRQYNLDNGQGVAPGRAYGGTSRAKTRRAYGDF